MQQPGKTVTITSSYSGADVSNYSVTDQSSTTANITAKALTVSGITASNKTYDSTTTATLDSSSVSYSGLVTGDIFTGSYSGVFANANVGTGKTINITSSYSGADFNNYTVTGDMVMNNGLIAQDFLQGTFTPGNLDSVEPQHVISREFGYRLNGKKVSIDLAAHWSTFNNFIASKQEGCASLEVNFTNLAPDAINYFWDFGDGQGLTV